MSVANQKQSVAANVKVPPEADRCNAFSGQDSDMNVQATEIVSRDESHLMSRSCQTNTMSLCLWIAMLIGESQSAQVDFETQVMPILTKAGCNNGACHGAAAGRGGFSLSLFGSRPAADFAQMTLALEGRRIDRIHSELSLLLLKPTEQLSHEGGTRLALDSRDFKTVLRWIDQGARQSNTRRLREFSFSSEAIDGHENRVVGQRRVQLIATARFSDDSVDDVLPWTVLTPNDPDSLSINENGIVTLSRPGRHLMMARFLDQVRPLEFIKR